MEKKMRNILERLSKETERLTPEEQLELVEKLVHRLRKRGLDKRGYLDWSKLYGLGKGL